jgi:hypothetical protein
MKKLLVLSLFILAATLSSLASTVQRLTFDDLVRTAHAIVHGKVRSSTPHWSTDHRLILTTTIIDIQETIKGQPSRTVELTTIGGKIGDLTLVVPGMPAFTPGEEAVLFVENVGAVKTIVGLAQGKFAVQNGEVANPISGAPLKMRLDDFKRQIIKRLN